MNRSADSRQRKEAGKFVLDALGDARAEGRVGEDDLHLLLGADGVVFGLEAVPVVVVRDVDAVEDEIGEAEDVGDRLVFPAGDGLLEHGLVDEGADVVFPDVVDGGAEEAAGAGGGVEHLFAEPRIRHAGHQLGDGARGVEFALVPGIAELDEDGLVDGAEDVAVVAVVEVEAVELVDDLAHRVAGLHVVVRAVEDLPHQRGPLRGLGGVEGFQVDEKAVGRVVDEVQQLVAGDALGIRRPVPPLEFLRDDGAVAGAQQLEFLVLVVEDLEEKHPAELLQPLGVAGDALVLVPHDVADILDDCGDVGNGNGVLTGGPVGWILPASRSGNVRPASGSWKCPGAIRMSRGWSGIPSHPPHRPGFGRTWCG